MVMRMFVVGCSALMCCQPAYANGSYLLADGVNRAPAVTLHCAGASGTAQPCGTSSNPLAVTAPVGGATAANQTTQVSAEQSSAQALGTPTDGVFVGGAGTLTGLLKGIWTVLTGGVPAMPVGGAPTSRSTTLPAAQSFQVFPANPARRYLAFQAPQNTGVWVNFTGGPAAPGGTDCAFFAAGSLYESGQFVDRGAITMSAAVAVAIAAWEN